MLARLSWAGLGGGFGPFFFFFLSSDLCVAAVRVCWLGVVETGNKGGKL